MIMKRVLTFICFLISFGITGQNYKVNELSPANAVASSKLQGKFFEEFKLVKSTRQELTNIRPEIRKELFDYQVLDMPSESLERLTQTKNNQISLSVPIFERKSIEVELVEVEIFASDFVVRTSSNPMPQEVELGKFYRGVIKGEEGSLASLTVQDGHLTGIFSSPKTGNWVIDGVDERSNRYLLYRDEDKVNPATFVCHTKESGVEYSLQQITNAVPSSNVPCTGIYFEVDNDIYRDKGGTNQTVNYISAIFNEVATLYANEDLRIVISEIFVWDSNSPYSGQSSSSLLSQFQQRRTSFNGDLAQLLSYKASGGIAVLDGLCHPYNSAKMSFSSIGSSFRNVPDYSFTVMVVAHELGHLFGSHHTHACVWNGNGTAIDACAGFVEGNCGSAPIPQGGGTIMSYCHLQRVGINFSAGFGIQPGNVIRNNVAQASCLQTCADDGGGGGGGNGGGNGCNGNLINLTIVLDDYATETSWKVTGDNNEEFATGGPYQKGAGGSTVEEEICLPDGCYFFEIFDEYGDGLCCNYGSGSYEVIDVNGTVILSGSEFGFSEVQEFCVDQSGGSGGNNNCASADFSNYDIISYGGPQDLGDYEIQDNGRILLIENNAWKAIRYSYQVTPSTILQFDFSSTKEGEIHGIGMDDNNTISSGKTFKVHGTQNWGIRDFDDYPNNGDWKTYRIPIGKYNVGNFEYIFFTADHDSGSEDGNSYYRNVKVYEEGKCSFLPSLDAEDSPATLDAFTANDRNKSTSVNIYPNPANQGLTIDFNSKLNLKSTIYIYNSVGQIIQSTDIDIFRGFNQSQLDLSGLANGTYLLKFDNGGREIVKRFNVLH